MRLAGRSDQAWRSKGGAFWGRTPGSALAHRLILAQRLASIQLTGATDLLLRILDHLLPLSNPANGAREREQNREHVGWEAHRFQRYAGIEVDVRIELLLDEIIVVKRNTLELNRDVKQRIVLDSELVEHLMGGALHDLGARIIVLVNAMAEAHQAKRIVLVLRLGDVFGNVLDPSDLAQHLERGLVGAAVGWAPKASDTGGDAGERISSGGSGEAHGRGRGVLLVVSVQDKDAVERPRQDGVDFVLLARDREAHAQEIRRVIELILRIDEWLADCVFERHRRERRHFSDHADRSDFALPGIADVGRVVIEGGERADARHHYGHRVRVATETVEETVHLIMHHRVARDAILEVGLLRRGRQLSIQEQVAGLEEIAVLSELVDWVAPVEEHALVAVDIGDLGFRARGRGKARVVSEHARLGVELAYVDHRRANGAFADRQFDGFSIHVECGGGRGSWLGFFIALGKGGGGRRHRASPIHSLQALSHCNMVIAAHYPRQVKTRRTVEPQIAIADSRS